MSTSILRMTLLAGACVLSSAVATAAESPLHVAQAAPDATIKPQPRQQPRDAMTETERQEIRQEQLEDSQRGERDADKDMRGSVGSDGRHEDRPGIGPGGRGMGLGTGRASDSETRAR